MGQTSCPTGIEVQLICSIYHIRFGDYQKNFWKMQQILLRSVPNIYKKKGGIVYKKKSRIFI
ncbi:hypothetical protein CAI90_07070 [Listeria monocytogenes]|uniref:Uncharacterized protein n=2 Tax=Listeria monocytogenes TaxID=1639 RepID=A0A460WGW0_LISMN|nr:hypothetical protein B0X19_10620 [Listeria monocytogenes]EAE6067203.1 hypothetical protein [Listeria monocytogenes serotype 1/2a]EAG6289884.1 hypothetical protein [Listeria monocytogenes CFSAN003825]EAG6317138.1 hypothetical protein [Listeria monocytogenes CFSAN003824]EAG6340709.1 hypothetical protein [Listeria monocytogenes CFSAN003811]EEW22119.1 predicted protein [Listeria monocytogenes F6900]EFF98910.1 predicted protein [Listeria monocytogenes J2818]